MSNASKHKHLDYIQNIINRLANNSFIIKGWAVTLASAILVIAGKGVDDKMELMLVALIPVFCFWLLDAYFLWQENLFRELYKEVSQKREEEIDFKMNVGKFIPRTKKEVKRHKKLLYRGAMFSSTQFFFYFSLVLLMVVIQMIIWIV